MLFPDKTILSTFLYFLDPDEVHRSLCINDFFTSFVNVYPSHILSMSKGISYLLKFHGGYSRKPTPSYVDVDGASVIEN
jgi:hypothetical protein